MSANEAVELHTQYADAMISQVRLESRSFFVGRNVLTKRLGLRLSVKRKLVNGYSNTFIMTLRRTGVGVHRV